MKVVFFNKKRKTNTKPRIIHMIWSIPYYRAPIFQLLSQNENFYFEICSGDDNTLYDGAKVASATEVETDLKMNWRKLKSSRIKWPIFRNFEWQPEAIRIACRENIDVVITLGYQSLSNILVRFICCLRGIPVIEWTQGVIKHERGLRWLIRKLYYKFAKAFLLYGDFAKDFFASHGFDEKCLFVVHNSLNHSRQVEIREKLKEEDIRKFREKELGLDSKTRLIVHSGRLESQKRLPILITALDVLRKKGSKIFAVLVGNGREKEELKKLVKTYRLDEQVLFYGSCYDEEQLGLIFSASDLCVVPGAVGLIAMHSLVYGTPVLTCKNTEGLHGPEVDAVIEKKTGRYFENGNMEDLIAKMEDMLYPTPSKDRMSQACKEIIDNYYTPEYQERVIIQALNYVLSQEKQIPVP